MQGRIWATFERLVPRGVVAASTMCAAIVTDPHSLGLYSWATLSLTLFGAFTDGAISHLATVFAQTHKGRAFLRRYMLAVGALGVLWMTVSLAIVASVFGGDSDIADFLPLMPLAFVPLAQALAVQSAADIQREELWRKLSLFRAVGAAVGAAVGIPLVFAFRSVVGACAAMLISEAVYTLLVRSYAHINLRATSLAGAEDGHRSQWTMYRDVMQLVVFGWLQGNLERGLLGMWAGTSALGIYTLGSAVARSAGDAISIAEANVLRVRIDRTNSASDREIRLLYGRNIISGMFITTTSAAIVTALSLGALPHILGPQWTAATEVIPIISLSAIPLTIAVCSTPVHVARKNSRILYIAPATCLLFAPFVALAAMSSLTLAAWIVLFRECAMVLINAIMMKRAAPVRELTLAMTVVLSGALAVFVLIH